MEEDDTGERTGTLEDRESLIKPFTPKRTGFKPRSIQQLTSRKPPRSMLNVECSHMLRCSKEEISQGNSPVMHTMWVEAGKHNPPFPERPDSNYNSNVWRNFRKSYGFYTSTKGQKISEMIAQLYPLNLPPPSKVGEYTYPRFLSETPLIKDEKMRKLAIERTTQDILEFKRIRLKSEVRNPPMDERGDIMPPVNFKKYAPRFLPPTEEPPVPPSTAPQTETRVDLFGKQVPVIPNKREPFMWKLSNRLNNPEYEKVQEYRQQVIKSAERQHPPAIVRVASQRPRVS